MLGHLLNAVRGEPRPVAGIAVFSGPVDTRDQAITALKTAGFKPLPTGILGVGGTDWRGQPDSHGLPSHRSPAVAEAAGVPNAGHTPGKPHPVTGQSYVEDPRVSWITVPMPED